MKKIAILGSTGSIGTQTLEIVRDNPDLQVMGLAAGSNAALMEKQIREFHPALAVMWSEEAAKELRGRTADLPVKVLSLIHISAVWAFLYLFCRFFLCQAARQCI